MMKKTLSALALATLALGAQAADVALKMAASAVPHADVDLALINTNYAIEAKLNPTTDALFPEYGSSHYANFIAARKDRANDPSIPKLVKALHTPQVKQFIQDKYNGAIIPAF